MLRWSDNHPYNKGHAVAVCFPDLAAIYEAIQLLGFHFGDNLIFSDVPLLGIVDQSAVQEWFTVMSVTKMGF